MSTTAATKIAKHRASKACERCRIRKVRCDIVLRSGGCTNCSLDDLDCVQPGPRRRRGPGCRSKKAQIIDTTSPVLVDSYTCSSAQDSENRGIGPSETSDNGFGPAAAVREQSVEAINHENGQPVPDSNEDLFPDFTGDLLEKGPAAPSLSQKLSDDLPNPSENTFESLRKLLPAFAAHTRSQRTYMYADFLHTQGAFSIPPPRLLRALLSRYVECVHPQLPLVDIYHVLQAVASDGAAGKVSFFLLQAMLLAASAFVDAQCLSEAGYSSRMSLRREQAERVRLLYDFEFETDRLVLVQSLILMTSWQDKGDEVKHLRHWLSIAYNIALLLGLNKELPARLNVPAKHRSLRKRLWWSLYMRDRTLSLGLRQWPIVAVEVCEISEPVVEDFDVHPASAETSQMLEDCLLLRDLDQQIRLTEIFRAQLQLSHQIYDVFKARYTVVAPKMGSTRMIAVVLVPKPLDSSMPTVQACSEVLEKWFKRLADNLRYRTPLSLYFDPGEDVLVLHCGILNLFYYALVCALHRPYPSPVQKELPVLEKSLHRKARHAANAIFSILEEFQALDTICFMPTPGITFMLQGAVTALCDTTSTVAQVRSQSHRRLQTCLEILSCLRDVHAYAPYATNFLIAAAATLGRQSQILRNGAGPIPRQTSPPTFLPASVQAPPLPFMATEIRADDWIATTESATSPALELCNPSDIGLPEISSYSGWGSFDCEPLNAHSGWEFFLDLSSDLS